MIPLIYLDGMVVENGTFKPENLMVDIVSTSNDVFMLIGLAVMGAVVIGMLYAIYLLLTQGS